MKIAFTGTHGTGKTTLLNKMKAMSPYSHTYTFIDEITRRMVKKGIPINEGGSDITQLLIMNSHLSNNLKDDVIMDRCALDGVVYTRWMYNKGKVSEWVMNYAEELFQMIIGDYDRIFYLVPEFSIEDDGVRSVHLEFRNEIVTVFNQYITDHKIPVIRLSGSVEHRLKKVIEKIENE